MGVECTLFLAENTSTQCDDIVLKCIFLFQISFLGDSHSRYNFFYLLKLLGNLDPKMPQVLRGTRTVDNIKFQWGHYASELFKKFNAELTSLTQLLQTNKSVKHKPVVILSAMQWNMKDRKTAQYLFDTKRLASQVKKVVSDGKIRIIYISATPWPNNQNELRNLYIVRALNSIAVTWFRDAGAQVLDISDMLYSVNDYDVCKGHYMCIKPSTQKVDGMFGPVVADMIIKEICNTKS